jgi:SAM-dependent methyltransferase
MSRLAQAVVIVLAAACPAAVVAQAPAPAPQAPPAAVQPPSEPFPGQAGKDVIWLPTPESVVERMLTMAQVGPRDVVYDLGSGDGRLVLAAARRGAQAVGVEFNADLVAVSERSARRQGLSDKARFVQGDIFATDFSRASVVTLYLLSTLNLRLRPAILDLKPGTRVVSHAFTMDDWSPDEVSRSDSRHAYFWIVPAKVAGGWTLELPGGPYELTLEQKYQKLDGSTIALGGVSAGLREAALRGDAIHFGFVDARGVLHELAGTVAADRMSGTFRADSQSGRWTATRR